MLRRKVCKLALVRGWYCIGTWFGDRYQDRCRIGARCLVRTRASFPYLLPGSCGICRWCILRSCLYTEADCSAAACPTRPCDGLHFTLPVRGWSTAETVCFRVVCHYITRTIQGVGKIDLDSICAGGRPHEKPATESLGTKSSGIQLSMQKKSSQKTRRNREHWGARQLTHHPYDALQNLHVDSWCNFLQKRRHELRRHSEPLRAASGFRLITLTFKANLSKKST